MPLTPLRALRAILVADALLSGAAGLLMTSGAGPLAPLLGLPSPLLRVAGLLLLPFAAFVGWLTFSERRPAATAVWTVIVVNVAWTVASCALLIAGGLAPTLLGYVFVLGQALVVFALGELQFFALRRLASS